MATIQDLPNELILIICDLLSTRSILNLAATCHGFHGITADAITTLELDISRPLKLYRGLLSRFYHSTIRQQNVLVAGILKRYGRTLKVVKLVMWQLETDVAEALASLKNLKSLQLRLLHPDTHSWNSEHGFRFSGWRSTAWNNLFHAKDSASRKRVTKKPVLGELRKLDLELAGITDWQLQRLIGENKKLETLCLRRCNEISVELFCWLAQPSTCNSIRTLIIENRDIIDKDILDCISCMSGLKRTSFRGSRKLERLRLPGEQTAFSLDTQTSLPQAEVMIDPLYM